MTLFEHGGFRREGKLKSSLCTSFFLLVTGCAANGASAADTDQQNGGAWSYVYACENDFAFSVRFIEDSAVLVLDGQTVELPHAISASGARYAVGDVEFWGKGNSATLQTPTRRYEECEATPAASVWQDAALRGVAFRAVGREPGWYVELMPENSLLFVADAGQTIVRAKSAAVRRDEVMGRTDYNAPTDDGTLVLSVDDAPCIDVVTGEAFPARARIQFGGRLLLGCGRWLAD